MKPNETSLLPRNFAWGAAAASYQIEGAAAADGKGPSIWDMFCRRGDRVWQGQTGDTACNHYHRYEEDVAIMKSIGLKAYRMSVSWPRVIPDGSGATNAKGLDFYDRLVDSLLRAEIDPWITLYHWDLPQALYYKGGWLNREIVKWFADYAGIVTDRLSDRVTNWMTLNEPQVFIGLGMETGRHAPGDKLGLSEVLLAAHHALMAHGAALQQIRSRSKKPCKAGWAPVGVTGIPETESAADVAALRSAMFDHASGKLLIGQGDETQIWSNTWWSDPVVFGEYPQDTWKAFGSAVPKIHAGDMETIRQPLDFYGANIYHGPVIRASKTGTPERGTPLSTHPRTAFNWPVSPEVLYWGPKLLAERYKLPIVVTENGVSCRDWVSLNGAVHDPSRSDFIARYLLQLLRAMKDGTDVRGYFLWSILDNFEWAEGFKERFGIVYVDFDTQKRIIKDSGNWYANVIKTNGAELVAQL